MIYGILSYICEADSWLKTPAAFLVYGMISGVVITLGNSPYGQTYIAYALKKRSIFRISDWASDKILEWTCGKPPAYDPFVVTNKSIAENPTLSIEYNSYTYGQDGEETGYLAEKIFGKADPSKMTQPPVIGGDAYILDPYWGYYSSVGNKVYNKVVVPTKIPEKDYYINLPPAKNWFEMFGNLIHCPKGKLVKKSYFMSDQRLGPLESFWMPKSLPNNTSELEVTDINNVETFSTIEFSFDISISLMPILVIAIGLQFLIDYFFPLMVSWFIFMWHGNGTHLFWLSYLGYSHPLTLNKLALLELPKVIFEIFKEYCNFYVVNNIIMEIITLFIGLSLFFVFLVIIKKQFIYLYNFFTLIIYLLLISFMLFTRLLSNGKEDLINSWLFNDGLSILFVLLTGLVVILCFQTISFVQKNKIKLYTLIFILYLLLVSCFLTTNLLVFYILFEATLIPIYLIITGWGSQTNRSKAGYLLFLYTIAGSTFFLLSLVYIHLSIGSFNYVDLQMYIPEIGYWEQFIIFILLTLGLFVKVPLFFFHSWLTVAHVEAPTVGSVILASLLLKLGGYGLIRFPLTLFPVICYDWGVFIYIIGLLGFSYASIVASRQLDLKRFIAYTSIAHMNLAVGGLFLIQENSYLGSVHTMVSHGVISAALFFLVGFLYERTHVRNVLYYSGLTSTIPLFSFYFFIFMIANAGLPIFSGFPGEFFTILGIANYNVFLALPVSLGFLWTIGYTCILLTRILFGTISLYLIKTRLTDLITSEKKVLNNLFTLTLLLGIIPNVIFLTLGT